MYVCNTQAYLSAYFFVISFSEDSSVKKQKSNCMVSMDTVIKASGWKLKVDTPEGVYKDIQNETEVSLSILPVHYFDFMCIYDICLPGQKFVHHN